MVLISREYEPLKKRLVWSFICTLPIVVVLCCVSIYRVLVSLMLIS